MQHIFLEWSEGPALRDMFEFAWWLFTLDVEIAGFHASIWTLLLAGIMLSIIFYFFRRIVES